MDYYLPKAEERQDLVEFLGSCWRQDHLFVQDPSWLDWQHRSGDGESYHIVVARDAAGDLQGFLGVMPLNAEADLVSTGIWIARKGCPDRTVGLKLFSTLEKLYKPRYIGSIGVNTTASAVLQVLGHSHGSAKTFVFASSHALKAGLATGLEPDAEKPPVYLTLSEISGIAASPQLASTHIPAKPRSWYEWRYECGSPFDYRFFLVGPGDGPTLLVVARVLRSNGGSCLRIIDIMGDLRGAGRFAPLFGPLLEREGHEYVELLVGGTDLSAFLEAGFRPRPPETILPAWFDPFIRANSDPGWTIKLSNRCAERNVYIFRGDGDQDRPNRSGPVAPSYEGRPV